MLTNLREFHIAIYISKQRLKDYIETWNEWKSQTTGILSTRLTVGRRERVHLPRQVQQVTCCPHPGDNLVMEIKPKYKADVGSPAAGSDGEVSTPAPLNSLTGGEVPGEEGELDDQGNL